MIDERARRDIEHLTKRIRQVDAKAREGLQAIRALQRAMRVSTSGHSLSEATLDAMAADDPDIDEMADQA